MSRHGGPTRGPDVDHALVRRIVPAARLAIRAGYFDLEVHGVENLPADGRAVYAANHAGWFPLDAFFLGLTVSDALGERSTPRFAAADTALGLPGVGRLLRRMGALPASWFRRPERLPEELRAVGIFPEGVEGNCKPFWRAYRMRPWNRGFVRVALARRAPIVPVAILGGEECLPVAWTVRALEPWVGSIFGLPLTAVPLPSRWKIVFLPPVSLAAHGRAGLADAAYCAAVARRIQRAVQLTIDRERRARPIARLSAAVAKVWPDRRARRASPATEERRGPPGRRPRPAPVLRLAPAPQP